MAWTRRRFLRNAAWAFGALGIATPVLAACGSSKKSGASSTTTAGGGGGSSTTAAGTTTSGVSTTVSNSGKTVKIRIPIEEPGFASPGVQADLGSSFLGHVCSSGLWVFDSSRKVIPGDVGTYTPSADLKTHTIKLRPDLKWSDGTPYDARTYEWSMQFMAKTFNSLADRWLKGAGDIMDGKVKDYTTIGWHADPNDPNTLIVETIFPVNFFEIWAGGRPNFFVQPKHNIDKYGDKDYATFPHTAHNGPYMIGEWNHNTSLKLVRNPYYTGPAATPDEIDLTVFTSALDVDAFNAFLGDQLDVAVTPIANMKTVAGDAKLKDNSGPQTYADVTFVLLNCNKKPFDDVRVRQALYMAIDRDSLVTDVLQGRADPAYGVISPAMKAGYVKDARPFTEISVAKAQQLLSDAGFPGGKGFPTIKYIGYQNADQSLVAQYVQDQWKKNLGVSMTIQSLDPGSWFGAIIATDPTADWGDACDAFWPSDYPEPSEIVGQLFDHGGVAVYHHHWQKSADLETLQEQALFANDPATRSKLLNDYDMKVASEVPLIPLFFPRQIQVHKPNITGGFYFYGTDFYQVRYLNAT
jgi:oligopeptide transport system substrate-binding protein